MMTGFAIEGQAQAGVQRFKYNLTETLDWQKAEESKRLQKMLNSFRKDYSKKNDDFTKGIPIYRVGLWKQAKNDYLGAVITPDTFYAKADFMDPESLFMLFDTKHVKTAGAFYEDKDGMVYYIEDLRNYYSGSYIRAFYKGSYIVWTYDKNHIGEYENSFVRPLMSAIKEEEPDYIVALGDPRCCLFIKDGDITVSYSLWPKDSKRVSCTTEEFMKALDRDRFLQILESSM